MDIRDIRPFASVEGIADTVSIETLKRFSPVAAIEEASPKSSLPLLVARAGQDHPALNAPLDACVQAALAANMTLDVLNHPAGYHAFDVRNDDARTREIIAHTLRFVSAHLGACAS